MFLKTKYNLGYLSQIALESMQLLILIGSKESDTETLNVTHQHDCWKLPFSDHSATPDSQAAPLAVSEQPCQLCTV